MPDTQVLITGAGPTGLNLALWLTRLGIRVRIIDKAAEPRVAPTFGRLCDAIKKKMTGRMSVRRSRARQIRLTSSASAPTIGRDSI